MPNPIRNALRMVLIAGAVMFVASVFSIGSAYWVRHTFVATLTKTAAISNARRDVDDLRVAENRESRSLMRYARSRQPGELLEYRAHAYNGISALTANALHQAEAEEALVPLMRAAEIHADWLRRTDLALATNRGVFQLHAGRSSPPPARATIEDFERSNDRISEQIAQVRQILDDHEAAMYQQVNGWIPFWIATLAFIAVTLAAAGIFALILGLRFLRERARVDRLLQAFRGVELPLVPLAVFDGVLAPVSRADRVGGDWYDVRMLPDGKVFITIGDVAGHGVEAAVTTAHIRRTLLGAAIGQRDPAAILALVNNEHAAHDQAHVATLCAFYDPLERELCYASAGLPAPLVRDGATSRFLHYGGPPLGALAGYHYETFREELEVDAVLVLYTDGVLEHAHDTVLGERTLGQLVRRVAMDKIAHRLYQALFARNAQIDDVAILTLHVKPA